MKKARLTPAQGRIYAAVHQAWPDSRVYNGRARRSIEVLESLHLVHADYDMVPHAKGSGIELTQRITVTLSHGAWEPDPDR